MKLAVIHTSEDTSYLPRLKRLCGGASVGFKCMDQISTWFEVAHIAKKAGCSGIITTSQQLLAKLTGDPKASVNDYAGSYFKRDELEVVIVDPLKQLFTVPYGEFLTARTISKLTTPDRWMKEPEFSWEIASETSLPDLFSVFSSADLLSVDTETFRENLAIRCVGYCGVWFGADGNIKTHTIVLPITSMTMVHWMRKMNALPIPKILQNGKYDHAYFFRYNSPCSHWFWDTANCMHAWYSELPKDLGFLGSFFRRTGRYWKDAASQAANLEEYYLYNARDCYNTALVFLSWIREAPAFARQNYLQKFYVNFPSHFSEMVGVRVNESRRQAQEAKLQSQIETQQKDLCKMVATPGFNPNSPKQVKELLHILGCKDLTSSDDKSLKKAMFRHPLNARILQKIIDIRKARKLVSTYLPADKFLKGRLLYAITPYGTDTGRAASQESPYWCGLQIQNIPAYTDAVKQFVEADDGYLFAEADFSQAESRGTAVLTGDAALLAAIASGRDFHSVNACAFFGRNYDDIWDSVKGKTKDKPLRDLSKRTNHGANYLMGALVLVDTMGEEAIYKAAQMLGLPKMWHATRIAEYLLQQFEKTYPTIRKDHPEAVIDEVKRTHMLVGPTGWTRYTFLDPGSNKLHLNSLVAHRAQSLNAMILDKAIIRIFDEIQMNPEYSDNFLLLAQIHDSAFFQYKQGHEYLKDKVRECMHIPVQVTDIKGVTRELVVPVDIKDGGSKGARFWAEC